MSSTTSTRTRAQAAAAAPVQTAEQITDALDRTEGTGDLDRREVHVYGPPGTGKTTWLTGRIGKTAIHRRGRVLVSSFTVAAATELAGRNLPLPKRAVGTLHSHALRAIEYPDVAAEQIAEFNEAHPGYALAVPKGRKSSSGEGRDIDVSVEEWAATAGDRVAPGEVLQGQYDRLRNRMVPRDQWPGDVARFATVWERWKRDAAVVDFTDMIEIALRDTDEAPGDPEVIFCDEVQDNTTLELALVRKWGRRAERIILAGDDDQMIYGFRGASVDGFVGQEVHLDDVYVLGRSYRVPWAVHRCAENWIRRVETRAEKPYSPRLDDGGDPHEGRALASRATYEDTSSLLASVEKQVAAGRTVMVLAACSYMLDPFKHALRSAGMPFHNQYRRKRGDWNPLGGGGEGRVSSAERLAAYLVADEAHFGDAWRLWTGEDVRRWSHVVKKSGIFAHGAKAAIEGLPGRELTQDEFMGLLREDLDEVALDRIAAADLDWFRENLLGSAHQAMQFPIQVAARRGGAALLAQPQVTLGTIHSVKGGQADVVYLIPDLSQKGAEQFARAGETRDGIVRQFYVGMTRAREELVVLSPTSDNAVPQVRMLQGARRPVAA